MMANLGQWMYLARKWLLVPSTMSFFENKASAASMAAPSVWLDRLDKLGPKRDSNFSLRLKKGSGINSSKTMAKNWEKKKKKNYTYICIYIYMFLVKKDLDTT